MGIHLTTPDSVREDVRPMSNKIKDDRILPYIEEVEQRIVKPRISDELYIDLLLWIDAEDKTSFPEEYEMLMNGGIYETYSGKKIFKGLKMAVNYYVYAKILKNNDLNITRFGVVSKEEEYSSRVELSNRLAAEKDVLQVADGYISECIDYLNVTKNITKFKKAGKQRSRLDLSVIGD